MFRSNSRGPCPLSILRGDTKVDKLSNKQEKRHVVRAHSYDSHLKAKAATLFDYLIILTILILNGKKPTIISHTELCKCFKNHNHSIRNCYVTEELLCSCVTQQLSSRCSIPFHSYPGESAQCHHVVRH